MSGSPWLARLKNERAPEMAPTKPTKPRIEEADAGFVGFAGSNSGAEAKSLPAGNGGFVGFAGAGLEAAPNSPRPEPEQGGGAAPAELMERYPRAGAEPVSAQSTQVRAASRTRARLSAGHDDAFEARAYWFTERGLGTEAAEGLAERLASRDKDGDDRRMCLECTYLGASGRCVAAATGRLPGASPRLEPVQTILMRCEAFGLRKGLR